MTAGFDLNVLRHAHTDVTGLQELIRLVRALRITIEDDFGFQIRHDREVALPDFPVGVFIPMGKI